ncbi:MAG: hydantoinase/oxoprolinase family protein [Actinobacteria bacterium]|nr:hydantoinase/oxoprolinase family protein [Actinomycetota bacterium]
MAENGTNGRQYQLALDAGGTMTDTFLVDGNGEWALGKSLSSLEDESISYLESVKDACAVWDLDSSDVHAATASALYTGTAGANAVTTGDGKKVGLLVSIGQRETPILDRGFTWLEHHPEDLWKYQLHEHPRPMVDPEDIKAITERVASGSYLPPGVHYEAGRVVIPLDEDGVRTAVEELLESEVEVIGICFLNSPANPDHEHRAAEIAREVIDAAGADMKVICSVDICPRTKDHARTKSLLVECAAGQIVRQGLERVEKAAHGEGLNPGLHTLVGYGAAVDIRYPRLFETFVSGPIGGLLGGKAMAEVMDRENLVCVDLGGTTFECGLLVDRELSLTSEPNFQGHRLNMPMLDLQSIGAGAGTVIHVDPKVKRIQLGPKSAGYHVGICLDYPEITITDANVALGLLSPNNFLGGKIDLDRERAIEALEERLAKPLGMDVFDACAGVLDLQHAMLQDLISDTVAAKGYDPLKYTILVYGGAGPLHLWGMEGHVKFGGLATVPWAAAFSAFGAALADYFHRYEKAVNCSFLPELDDEEKVAVAAPMNAAWEQLERQALEELEAEGFSQDQVVIRRGISARYVGQLFSSWNAYVDRPRIDSVGDVDAVCAAFEETYAKTYPAGARHSEAGYLVTGVFLDAAVPKVRPVVRKYPMAGPEPSKSALKGHRDVYWNGSWVETPILDMDSIESGNRVKGPAVLEHPMTTMPVPEGRVARFDEQRVIWYEPDE